MKRRASWQSMATAYSMTPDTTGHSGSRWLISTYQKFNLVDIIAFGDALRDHAGQIARRGAGK